MNTADVKIAPRFIAALVFLGWLFASVHLAVEHGAGASSSAVLALLGHEGDHHKDDSDHHHHDLSALPAGPLTKATDENALNPIWVALCDALAERLTLALRQALDPTDDSTQGNAPPDARAGGWLLDARTALPVRGPSLGT